MKIAEKVKILHLQYQDWTRTLRTLSASTEKEHSILVGKRKGADWIEHDLKVLIEKQLSPRAMKKELQNLISRHKEGKAEEERIAANPHAYRLNEPGGWQSEGWVEILNRFITDAEKITGPFSGPTEKDTRTKEEERV